MDIASMSKEAIILKSDGKRQAERRSAAYCDPFCFAHAAGVISAI
jgi:hypothetical protein